MIEMGQKVRDTVTGFEGVATATIKYMVGRRAWLVEKPKMDIESGEPIGFIREWIDAPRLEVVPVDPVDPALDA